jgi:hypothetical protein
MTVTVMSPCDPFLNPEPKEAAVADPHDTERDLDTATLTDDDIRSELDDDTGVGDADGDDQDAVDGDSSDQDADADDPSS